MKSEEKVSSGLRFSLKILDINRENKTAMTVDESRNINLTFYFSGNKLATAGRITYEIRFVLYATYLEKYFLNDPESFKAQFQNYEEPDICCNREMILHEIVNCKVSATAYRQMFLESKALALLLSFQQCERPSEGSCTSCSFLQNPLEKQKIIKARDILLAHLHRPLTIPELATMVGTNQCYLKRGFKELFGLTVYNFVQEQRMLKAKLLLATTDTTVSQVADEVGFSSISNFSSAFKKITGIFPSEFQKTLA